MRIVRALIFIGALLPLVARPARAQDSLSAIRLGVRGAANGQPGLAVVAGPGIDSVLAIVRRDLEFSNRFTMPARSFDSLAILHGPFNPAAFKTSELTWVVELEPAVGGVEVKLYEITTGTIRQQGTRPLDIGGAGDNRLGIHRVSDEIVNWATGGLGMAATRIAFKLNEGKDGGIWRIDSDGANLVRVSRGGSITMTPAWSPDGASIAYSEHRDGLWMLFLQRLATGTRVRVPSPSIGNDYGANFSPDGKSLVYTHGVGAGADIAATDISRMCCAHLLTQQGRLADNVSPTYSPDGQRVLFASQRTGTTEIYVMDDDGTDVRQIVPSQFEPGGRPLMTYSPAWSPDRSTIAFDRDTPGGGRQLYTVAVGGGTAVQRTGTGRNDDPSWAPDSRHVVFKSNRGGSEQLWMLDLESGALRQLTSHGSAQYPAWSGALGKNP